VAQRNVQNSEDLRQLISFAVSRWHSPLIEGAPYLREAASNRRRMVEGCSIYQRAMGQSAPLAERA
jgi:hypothetical protein